MAHMACTISTSGCSVAFYLALGFVLAEGCCVWYLTLLQMPFRRYTTCVLVGGGVGITPVMGMLKDLYHVGDYSQSEKLKVLSKPPAFRILSFFLTIHRN